MVVAEGVLNFAVHGEASPQRFAFAGGPDPVVVAVDDGVSWIAWSVFGGFVLALWAAEGLATGIRGQTFGKWREQLRVVRTNGEPAGMVRATVRWAVLVLPVLAGSMLATGYMTSEAGLWFVALQFAVLAVPGSLFWADDRRGWCDRIAGTKVVMAE
jgi:uncharacterized RDD family membrane protein YckC